MKKLILLLFLSFLVQNCVVIKFSTRGFYPTVRRNVCKSLTNKVILYGIFVDSDKTHPWTEYDILSTIDSIKKSINWLELQSKNCNINLDIEFQYFSKNERVPVVGKFKYETLSKTLFHYNDIKKGVLLVDKWSDGISRNVARALPKKDSKIIATKNKMNNRERLIAKLRGIYKTDNVALMFFINNYYEDEMSVTLHNGTSDQTEYSVVSEKRPSVIAHEFLHLFGAIDFYITPFDKSLFFQRKKKNIMKYFPNEIMAFAHRNIDSLTISPITKYLIGWKNQMDSKYKGLIAPKNYKFVTY